MRLSKNTAHLLLLSIPVSALLGGSQGADPAPPRTFGVNCVSETQGPMLAGESSGLCAGIEVDRRAGRIRAFAEQRSERQQRTLLGRYRYEAADDAIEMRIDSVELRGDDGSVLVRPAQQAAMKRAVARSSATDWHPCPEDGTLSAFVKGSFRDAAGTTHQFEATSESVPVREVCAVLEAQPLSASPGLTL